MVAWVLTLHLYFPSLGSVTIVEDYNTEHECRTAMMELVLDHRGTFDGSCFQEGN